MLKRIICRHCFVTGIAILSSKLQSIMQSAGITNIMCVYADYFYSTCNHEVLSEDL